MAIIKRLISFMVSVPTTLPAAQSRAGVPNEMIFRLRIEQYHQMIRTGILTGDDPIELLDGWLVYKMPKNRQHIIATHHVRDLIARSIPPGWHVESQEPITLEESEPEPDVCVVRGALEDYPDRHSRPEDVALLVEVSDTALDRDRGVKKRLYAQAAIPIYWIVNLPDQQIEVYTQPSGPDRLPDYHCRQDYPLSEAVPLVIDGCEIGPLPVRQLLP